MGRMTRQIRGNSRRVAAAMFIVAATSSAGMITVPAAAAPSASPALAPQATSASRQYVAVARSGSTQRLHLVDRVSGKVVRTLASARVDGNGEAFADADLAADGSVYAVVRTRSGGQYGWQLVRYSAGRATTILPYVTSVEASPNGRQLAVTVVSPDGNRDGKGLEALRIVSPAGKVVRTLTSTAFPVDRQGNPQYETGGLRVQGWMNAGTLVVRTGCCSDSNVHLVRADVPRSPRTWPTFDGEEDAMALGAKGTSVLVARPWMTGDGRVTPFRRAGVEVAWLSAKRPRGVVVQRLKGENVTTETAADALVKKYGATPLFVSAKKFPYRGSGKVVAAHV